MSILLISPLEVLLLPCLSLLAWRVKMWVEALVSVDCSGFDLLGLSDLSDFLVFLEILSRALL